MFQDMVDFLDKAWVLKEEIVPCLIGPVGIGKTAAVMQHAKNVGATNVVKIVASQILPNEVSGITMPNDNTRSMDIYDHYRLSSMKDGDILFFDELLEADQSVLKACLTLIESRELMSGKKLPDIQIIAATNPTILASSLAENIRQRFMFKKFDANADEAIRFIKEETGLNLIDLRNVITCEGSDYNILTPRSLTKLARWCMKLDDDELDSWSKDIDNMFRSALVGSFIVQARRAMKNDPEFQVRKKLEELWFNEPVTILTNGVFPDFKEDSFEEMKTKFEEAGVWGKFKSVLADTNVVKEELEINY